MGVVSRRVVPACGNLCFLCPAMRARSRHPVKRYKKLISDIFVSKNPVSSISKLSNYASKNPLRVPEITQALDHRFYRDLRSNDAVSVELVVSVYTSFLSNRRNIPLFASSLLPLLRTLLDQARHPQLRLLACQALVQFIATQPRDSAYMFNLEGLIPKLCELAHLPADLRSAAMQALASMVQFMGEQSHIAMDFDSIISVTLENFHHGAREDKSEPHFDAATTTMDNNNTPGYWSRVCLSNMAKFAEEATTIRRVLEPLLLTFDSQNHWSPGEGLAYPVLLYLQSVLEESGQNSHLLLSLLVKHLDHKTVVKQPMLQINILNVATQLAKSAKQEASVAIVGALTDLVKHLRKCLQNEIEASSQNTTTMRHSVLQIALEKGICQLSEKIGDVGPILEMMAVVLENIPSGSVVARTTMSAIYQTSKIVSSIPALYYEKKAFPDALFHQLLLAMTHPDHETRIGAHKIFSMVLMPSTHSPWLDQKMKPLGVVSGFPITTRQSVKLGSFSSEFENKEMEETMDEELSEEAIQISDASMTQSGKSYAFNGALVKGKPELTTLRLSSHQLSLLLSSIWVQATSVENTPANFEAMAQSYKIALMFTRSKTSSYAVLVRCFQLAFSIRTLSIDKEGDLQPSRRRSLFTLASFMLLCSARAGNFPDLIPLVKVSLTDKMVDPHLRLVDDARLQAVFVGRENGRGLYQVDEDEVAALKSLSAIELDDRQLKETVISNFITRYAKLSEDELASIKDQVLQGFSPDDEYPLGAPLFMETPRPCSPLAHLDFPDLDEVVPATTLTDEEAFLEASGSQSDRKTSMSINSLDVLSVNQLLESVLETARQVASFPVSSMPIPYDQMKDQCEALVTGKQNKMSVLQSFKHQQEANAIVDGDQNVKNKDQVRVREQVVACGREYGQHSFRLPPSSPYDKFLKAAGC